MSNGDKNLKWLASRTAISPKSGYCYFRIAKSANSTIIRTLAHHDSHIISYKEDPRAKKTKRSFSRVPKFACSSEDFYFAYVQKFFKFTFVRNPYDRLASCYLDKIMLEGGFNKYTFMLTRKDISLSFEDFIKYLKFGGLYLNHHWCPQSSLIPIPINKLDFIGNVENMDTDIPFIINKIFGSFAFKTIINSNIGKKKIKYNTLYTPSLRAEVYKLYKADFINFGYGKEL